MPTKEDLLLTQDGFVATITINRAERHNVWSPAMGPTFKELVLSCAANDSVRVIVFTGAGSTFCAGADVAALQTAHAAGVSPMPKRVRSDDDFGQRYSFLLGVPKTIICALNGPAVGFGAVLPLFCDIRYASTNAKIAALFVRRGLMAEHGMDWILPRLIGVPRALEMLVSGRTVGAEEAERIGLFNAVFPQDTFRADVAQRAAKLATSVSPRAAGIIKRQVYQALSMTLAQASNVGDDELPGCIASEDFSEGVLHYLEKREPQFTGR